MAQQLFLPVASALPVTFLPTFLSVFFSILIYVPLEICLETRKVYLAQSQQAGLCLAGKFFLNNTI